MGVEAAEYYAEHIDSINNILLALNSEDSMFLNIMFHAPMGRFQLESKLILPQ